MKLKKRAKKFIKWLDKSEVIDHLCYGIAQGIMTFCVFLILNPHARAQEIAKDVPVAIREYRGTTYFEIQGTKLVTEFGQDYPYTSNLYTDIWKNYQLIKTLYEAGTENPKEFGVEFTTPSKKDKGIRDIRDLINKHFSWVLAANPPPRVNGRKITTFSIGVVPLEEGFLRAELNFGFSLLDGEDLTQFAEELIEALEAEEKVEVLVEPKVDRSHILTIQVPGNLIPLVKEIALDHLTKSGYFVQEQNE